MNNLDQGLGNSLCKDQLVNIFKFVGYIVSVATTQFCGGCMKVATDSMEMDGYVVFQ